MAKRIAIPVNTNELCSYGCGSIAKFKNGSNNLMCSERCASCPANKAKNSNSVKESYRSNMRKPAAEVYAALSQETKDRMNSNKGKRYAEFGNPGKGAFKNALLSERGHQCECCNLTEWLDVPIALEMDHSDGDRKNNTRENLKLLCPNCHAQTPTWRRGNGTGYHEFKRKRYNDNEMIKAIVESDNLNQALDKLDLRYGSAGTLVGIMSTYKVNFKN